MHLADRALRTRRASRPKLGSDPLVGPRPHPLLAPQAYDGIALCRVVPTPGSGPFADPASQADEVVGTGPADAVDPTRSGTGDHLALPGKRGVGHLPTAVDRADALIVGDGCSVEEHLVELHLTADVAQRTDYHSRLVQVQQKVGDPFALAPIRICSGEEHPEVGSVGPRRPDLLPGDDPLVAVALGPRGQRRQVRTRPRLTEQLTPHLLVAHDRREVAESLVLGSVPEQCRGGQVQPEGVEPAEIEWSQQLLRRSELSRGQVEAPVVARPHGDDETRLAEHRVPPLVIRPAPHFAHR